MCAIWRRQVNLIRPYLTTINERSEDLQAKKLTEQLRLLDAAGVDGAFVFCFVFPINPFDEHAYLDLDRESASLVKTYAGGRHGVAYPDMTWEPKKSFGMVADYYRALDEEKRK